MPGRPGDKKTVYARVAARIREQVIAGAWQLGQRLPSEGELAEDYGVSRGTVNRALQVLRDEGVIMTIHGRGSTVAVVPDVTVVRLGRGDTVLARMPDDAERDAMGLAPGVPLLAVTRHAGTEPELYDAAVTVIRGA
jgi:GntR family transcriptional regulator